MLRNSAGKASKLASLSPRFRPNAMEVMIPPKTEHCVASHVGSLYVGQQEWGGIERHRSEHTVKKEELLRVYLVIVDSSKNCVP